MLHPPNLFTKAWAEITFPDFTFLIRAETRNSWNVFQVENFREEKIGESYSQNSGFLFTHKRMEVLQFFIGSESIAVEFGPLNRWIHYKGERKKLSLALHISDDEEVQETTKRPAHEWRRFEIGELRLEHHDYESHYRIIAPTEAEGLLIAFAAFRILTQENSSGG